MALQGQRCILKGGPRKGHISGDSYDGAAIAVSPNVKWYHQLGSLANDKVKGDQGVWVHIYERTGRHEFAYRTSEIQFEDAEDRAAFNMSMAELKKKYSESAIGRFMDRFKM